MKKTSPGMTLRLFGRFSIRPTVPTASGACSRAIASMRSIRRAAPRSAFLRSAHRRRAGMGFLAGDRDLVPAHALDALHDADHAALGFEDRALLDMQLEHGREFARAGFLLALVADALAIPRRTTCRRDPSRIGVVAREHAGEDARGEHGRRKARAFFVGPVDDLDRRIGLVAGVVQRAHRFERGQDAEHAVEFAAGRLGVEMRAHGDRGSAGFLPGRRANMLPMSSTVTVQPSASHCALNQSRTWRSRSVKVSRQMPPFARRADPRRLHQRVPQPLGVDLQVLQGEGFTKPRLEQGAINPWKLRVNQGRRGCDSSGSEARLGMGRWLIYGRHSLRVLARGGRHRCRPSAQADRARGGGGPRLRDEEPGQSRCRRAECLFKLVANPCAGPPGPKDDAKVADCYEVESVIWDDLLNEIIRRCWASLTPIRPQRPRPCSAPGSPIATPPARSMTTRSGARCRLMHAACVTRETARRAMLLDFFSRL